MSARGCARRALQTAGLLAAALTGAASADTLDVPAEFPTIQGAIAAAAPGDTVLVAPGTYVATIDFLGKAITVQSSGGATVTTIDGGGAGSVVTFKLHETSSSVLQGFTITGGTGSSYGPFAYQVGGGIYILGSSPVVRECTIKDNTAADYGGGICIISGSLVLQNCTVSGNATMAAGRGGGGLMAYGAFANLQQCALTGNTTAGNGGGFGGTLGASLKLEGCLIDGNAALGTGGGGEFENTAGVFTVFEMNDCTISGNSASWGGGLGLSLQADGLLSPAAVIRRCRFTDNHATTTGGGMYASTNSGFLGGSIDLRDCVLAKNTAQQFGGGITALGNVGLVSCTLVGNSAPAGGGLLAHSLGLGPTHCIVWGNGDDQIAGTLPAPQWCDIQGGYPGTGNIDVAPHLVAPASGDFHLAPTSACVDGGSTGFVPFSDETDIDGDPRVLFGRIDIGADEATFASGPWTFLGHALGGEAGAPSLVGAGELTPGAETILSLSTAAPSTPAWLVAGAEQVVQPFKGGVMVPTIGMLVGPVSSNQAGLLELSGRWPNGIPPGFVVSLQWWIADPTGPAGFTASNGLAAESQ